MRFALAFAAFLISAPAAGQFVGKPPSAPVPPRDPFIMSSHLPAPSAGRDVRDIRKRVDDARDSGAFSRREARRLDREARQIKRLARRYGRDGLSHSERAELDARTRYLRDAVQVAAAKPNGK